MYFRDKTNSHLLWSRKIICGTKHSFGPLFLSDHSVMIQISLYYYCEGVSCLSTLNSWIFLFSWPLLRPQSIQRAQNWTCPSSFPAGTGVDQSAFCAVLGNCSLATCESGWQWGEERGVTCTNGISHRDCLQIRNSTPRPPFLCPLLSAGISFQPSALLPAWNSLCIKYKRGIQKGSLSILFWSHNSVSSAQ